MQSCGDPPLLRRQLEQLAPQRERPATRGKEQRSDARDGLTLLLLADTSGRDNEKLPVRHSRATVDAEIGRLSAP